MVDGPDPATDAGLKLAAAPAGSPLALKVTVPVKPPVAVTVVVYDVLDPCTAGCDAGVAEIEKSGVGGALQARTALLTFRRPPVTVMPLSDGIGSTLFISVLLRPAVSSAHTDNSSAAAPETCGVAIDVPLKY